MKCRFCDKEILEGQELAYAPSYWWSRGDIYPCHAECKKEGKAREAYDCQLIDADCNDCKFFNRRENSKWVCYGSCSNPKSDEFNKDVKAYPNNATGRECFVHRQEDKYGPSWWAALDKKEPVHA
jgi:hypothetical protein